MARHPRLILPGVALHVVQRGNNRNACFRRDSDYLTYLALLRHLGRKYQCAVHAYCLMTNHVHLLVSPFDAGGCGLLMRDLGRCYVPYFNRSHERTGTLWEGRFRACLVESARYVLACYRYIELNPVRAGMVNSPDEHKWSSHAGNGGIRTDPLLTPHGDYLALGLEEQTRRVAYLDLFQQRLESGVLSAIREATHGGLPLASDGFKAAVLAPAGARIVCGKPGPRICEPA
jgi:putative transposase